MRSSLTRATFVTLVVMLVAGCATPTPAPTVAPTQVAELPTQTPYPISTVYPTFTPYPTATIPPTATATPVPPTPTATATLTPTAAAKAVPVTPKPVAIQPAASVGSAELWRTPGAYRPVAANPCATYPSTFAGRDWEETFCIIKVEVNSAVMRFYGDWQIRLVRGTPRVIMFHPNSRAVTYIVDNLGNKYVHGRLGGAADADVKVYGNSYLLGYKDNDNVKFPHEPSAWWEFEPARPGATSFTFVNDRYGFKIGPITLSK